MILPLICLGAILLHIGNVNTYLNDERSPTAAHVNVQRPIDILDVLRQTERLIKRRLDDTYRQILSQRLQNREKLLRLIQQIGVGGDIRIIVNHVNSVNDRLWQFIDNRVLDSSWELKKNVVVLQIILEERLRPYRDQPEVLRKLRALSLTLRKGLNKRSTNVSIHRQVYVEQTRNFNRILRDLNEQAQNDPSDESLQLRLQEEFRRTGEKLQGVIKGYQANASQIVKIVMDELTALFTDLVKISEGNQGPGGPNHDCGGIDYKRF